MLTRIMGYGGLCTIIFTPIKVFTIIYKLITKTKNELLTYFNRYNHYITHISCPYFNYYSINTQCLHTNNATGME